MVTNEEHNTMKRINRRLGAYLKLRTSRSDCTRFGPGYSYYTPRGSFYIVARGTGFILSVHTDLDQLERGLGDWYWY